MLVLVLAMVLVLLEPDLRFAMREPPGART
jgi:hypothetical protein